MAIIYFKIHVFGSGFQQLRHLHSVGLVEVFALSSVCSSSFCEYFVFDCEFILCIDIFRSQT
jgi:hypothetical protein